MRYMISHQMKMAIRHHPLATVLRIACFMTAIQLVHSFEMTLRVDYIPRNTSYLPKWIYGCIPHKGCLRMQRSEVTSYINVSIEVFESLDVCLTVCGTSGGLWPKPVKTIISMHTVNIHPDHLRFDLTAVPEQVRELLTQMTQLVGPDLAAECGGNVTKTANTIVIIYINVKTSETTLHLNINEKYKLDVQARGNFTTVQIVAETVFGARHALETFTQLVAADTQRYSSMKDCGLLLVSNAKVRDRPVYKYRGLMIDCSRHFIPIKDLKRTIRGMAAVKMNVFHWHVTDSHSFPLQSTRVPQFTKYGAYSPQELYAAEDVRELVEYARVRGIRVIIEIDAPAHSGNGWQWGKDYGLGELAVCINAKPWRSFCIQPPCGQLNPANPSVYVVLKDLYKDIANLVPEPVLLHMGGDEVSFSCWQTSKEILTYMTDIGYGISSEGFMKLWAEFHENSLQAWDEVLEAIGSSLQPVIIWSSGLTNASMIQDHLSKDRYIIEVWEASSKPLLKDLLNLGYRIVSVPNDIWYLDHGLYRNPQFSNWRRMYSHMLPRVDNLLGGEAAMWTEIVDEINLDTRVWPRAAAVAERLWSDPSTLADLAEHRMQRMRRRLVARGLQPDALSPIWCEQHASWCREIPPRIRMTSIAAREATPIHPINKVLLCLSIYYRIIIIL